MYTTPLGSPFGTCGQDGRGTRALAHSGCTARPARPARPKRKVGITRCRVLFTFLLLSACAPSEDRALPSISVTDDLGRTVALSAPARRVFSVIPSITETVAALDPDALVARTRFDRAPEFAHLPSLGDGMSPNLEALARLEPDLVISWSDVTERVADRAEALGIAVYRADVQTIDGLRSHLSRLGSLLGREGRASLVTDSLDRALDRVATAVRSREPVSVYYSVWHDPPQTTGPGTFIDEVISLAGGRNIFADASRGWPLVSVEAVLTRNPDALVIPGRARGAEAVPWLRAPGWRELEAVRNGRFLLVDGDLFNRPGPRVAEAAEHLARFLHGEDVLPHAPAPPTGAPRPADPAESRNPSRH